MAIGWTSAVRLAKRRFYFQCGETTDLKRWVPWRKLMLLLEIETKNQIRAETCKDRQTKTRIGFSIQPWLTTQCPRVSTDSVDWAIDILRRTRCLRRLRVPARWGWIKLSELQESTKPLALTMSVGLAEWRKGPWLESGTQTPWHYFVLIGCSLDWIYKRWQSALSFDNFGKQLL